MSIGKNISREWRRICRQMSRSAHSILSYPCRSKLVDPIRQHERRYLDIPCEVLGERLVERFSLEPSTQPEISIVIPVFNQFEFTARCLLSLADHASDASFEIIVIDDCSSDATEPSLSRLPGLRYIRNPANAGFVDSCNTGADHARGTRLVFLNNDTIVLPGWMDALESVFLAHEDCGLAGSMLIYPNMTLQDAGGLVFRDGSAANRGKGEDLSHPDFNYVRPVDYCSGASLMISKDIFDRIGGFDTRYRPGYYEDTDLGFSIRHVGLRAYFQPLSKVIHFEGVTAGRKKKQGMKAYQKVNRQKFCEKWEGVLSGYPERTEERRNRTHPPEKGHVLVTDGRGHGESGQTTAQDMFDAMVALVNDGYHVDYVKLSNHAALGGQIAALQQKGVRCFRRPYFFRLRAFTKDAGRYDLVFDTHRNPPRA